MSEANAKCPYRAGLPERPDRMRWLVLDERGYPVPWFVQWLRKPPQGLPGQTITWKQEPVAYGSADGYPEFRIMDYEKRIRAVRERLCWVCGGPLGRYMAFTVGPMCAVNRVSSEPPSHRECAEYSVRACPFLTTPKEKRRVDRLPDGIEEIPGMIHRNPGVGLVWVTKGYRVQLVSANEFVLLMGDPESVSWWSEGRAATRSEVNASIEGGLPILEKRALKLGAVGMRELVEGLAALAKILPAADPPKCQKHPGAGTIVTDRGPLEAFIVYGVACVECLRLAEAAR